METISIVIPNFNGQGLLRDNMPSVCHLKKHNAAVVEIIVVDDLSTDSSIQFLKSHYPKDVKVIQKEKNTGFSDTVNIGVASSQGSLVLLLNTDTRPEENIIWHLLPFFEDAQTFAVGCLDSSVENNNIVKRGRGVGRFHKGFLVHSKGETNKEDSLWVAGGSGIFRKTIWNELCGLDSNYSPFYWEDIDISYRALKRGYKIFFAKDAVVVHFHEKGSIKTQYSDRDVEKIALRNQIIFVWKNITDTNFIIQHFVYLPYYILSALINGNLLFLTALWEAVKKLPDIYKKRMIELKKRKFTDYEVLTQFSQ